MKELDYNTKMAIAKGCSLICEIEVKKGKKKYHFLGIAQSTGNSIIPCRNEEDCHNRFSTLLEADLYRKLEDTELTKELTKMALKRVAKNIQVQPAS